jgi:diguanylate cyclase (GGDEF)-like protein
MGTPFSELPPEWIGAGVVLSVLALFLGLAIGRSGRGGLQTAVAALQSQLERAKSKFTDQERTVKRLRKEHATVANLALHLPHVVRDMNRNDLDPADVPKLIIQLANAVFQPGQLLLYGVRTTKGPRGPQRHLYLIDQRGLDTVPDELRRVRMGEGKIGWAAQHELDMLAEDWEKVARTERTDVPNNHRKLKPEIIGPLVHHSKGHQQVLGMLCMGAIKATPADPKLMFQMVTNFGSLALVNASNLKTLRSMANYDGLTGLLNKRSFMANYGVNALVECERKAQPLSVFIFDIDNFKNYNDTNGHPAGDELLRGMGKLIKENIGPDDVVCRYGGEEFVVAMPGADRTEALRKANMLREVIATEAFEHREKQPLGCISISGGVAEFPKDGNSIGELLNYADQALYRSKKGGRNRIAAHKSVEIGDAADVLPIDPATAAASTDGDAARG